MPQTRQMRVHNILSEIFRANYLIEALLKQKMRTWLSAPDPSNTHNRLQEEHHEGTGNWFFQGKEFKTWRDEPGSMLWIRGIRKPHISPSQISHLILTRGMQLEMERASFGESRMQRSLLLNLYALRSSNTIEHLEEDSLNRGIPHLYYYFNFRDESTQSCENFLLSINCQLLLSLPDIPSPFKELYARHKSGLHRPSVKDLTACFIAVIQTLDEVRLFGDGFDECMDWNNLWHFSSQLAKARSPSLHFLFTSRPERHIRDAVNSLGIPTVDLTCPEMNDDIKIFVHEQLGDPQFARISVHVKELVKERLISRAGGMYVPLSAPV
jgi:hypothetical protein